MDLSERYVRTIPACQQAFLYMTACTLNGETDIAQTREQPTDNRFTSARHDKFSRILSLPASGTASRVPISIPVDRSTTAGKVRAIRR